jgi:DNA-binding transcriptional ArsR family regulator
MRRHRLRAGASATAWSAQKGRAMPTRPDSAALNVQPRQRRRVYAALAEEPAGRSVKDLLLDFDIPESDIRESLRKLDDAGLAQRTKGAWRAVPLEAADSDLRP